MAAVQVDITLPVGSRFQTGVVGQEVKKESLEVVPIVEGGILVPED